MTFRMPTLHGGSVQSTSFNQAIESYGNDYILVRTNERFRCPRFNAATGDCDPPICNVCLGQKYIHSYEVHTMYKSLNKEPSYGVPDLVPFLFFCKSTSALKDGDRVLEVTWGSNGELVDIIDEYEIKSTHTYNVSRTYIYIIGAAAKIKLTTDLKTLRYLQDIHLIGVSVSSAD